MLLGIFLGCLTLSNGQLQSRNDQKIPAFIASCYRDDPTLSDCVRSTIYGFIRGLADGIPDLDIPPIEPLHKKEIDAFNVAGLRLKITNITLAGMSKVVFTWNSASTKTKFFDYKGYIDLLEANANYELSGPFDLVPIGAAGRIHGIGRDVDFRVHSIVDVLPTNGVDYVKVTDLLMTPYINEGSLWISNLGPFEVAINQLLNHPVNKRFIFDHVTPIIEESVSYMIEEYSNRVFNIVPYDTFLPKGTRPVPATLEKPHNDDDILRRR